MKIRIERDDAFSETEITLKCPIRADDVTEGLIKQLQMSACTVIGYAGATAHKLSTHDVFYFESVDEKTFIYTAQDVFDTPDKLYVWEQELKNSPFVRVSKSVILNTDKVESVRTLFGGKLEAVMSNGEKQIVNRHYVTLFRNKFGI